VHLFSVSGTKVVISKLPLLSDSPSYLKLHAFRSIIVDSDRCFEVDVSTSSLRLRSPWYPLGRRLCMPQSLDVNTIMICVSERVTSDEWHSKTVQQVPSRDEPEDGRMRPKHIMKEGE
jgi:hypothetical protein